MSSCTCLAVLAATSELVEVTLHDTHSILAWILIVSNGASGFWSLAAHCWPVLRKKGLWLVIGAAQLTTFGQATIGAVLSRQDGAVLNDMHALYGFSAIIAVAIMYSYRSSPFVSGNLHLLYGFGGLFVMGLGLRNLVL